MKIITPILFFLVALSTKLHAQPNLVYNGDFEYYDSCNAQLRSAHLPNWSDYNDGTCDYYNSCSSIPNRSVPSNIFGYQYAVSGNGYVGFNAFNNNISGGRECFTGYMTAMEPGRRYEVALYIAIPNKTRFFTNGINVHFFDTGVVKHTGTNIINLTPKINFLSYGIISDTLNWTRLSAIFTADSAYDHIAVGCFLDTPTMSYTASNFPNTGGQCYVWVDSITVKIYDSLRFNYYQRMLCSGDTISVDYFTDNKKQPGNIFTLQLSDSSGSFLQPVDIGSKTSDTSGTITAVIPSSTVTGAAYKLRLIASAYPDTTFESIEIKIGHGPIAKPVATNNSPVCINDTLKLTSTSATQGVSFSWTGPNNYTSNIQNPAILSPILINQGSYIVSTSLFGCTTKDTTFVIVNEPTGPPGTNATSNSPICLGDTLVLSGTSLGQNIQYSWTGPNSFLFNGQDTSIVNTVPAMSGDYILHATLGSCTAHDTIAVLVKPFPENVTAGYNAPVCEGEQLNMFVSTTSNGVTYYWTGPNSYTSTLSNPLFSNASLSLNGTYYVTTTLNGCSVYDTVSLVVKSTPAKPVAGNNSPVCDGDTLQLTSASSTNGVSYYWVGPGGFSSSLADTTIGNATATRAGNYIVTVNLNGCTAIDTTTVSIKPVPDMVTLANNSPLCENDTLKLFSGASSNGVTYNWSGPNSFSSSSKNALITSPNSTATGWYKMTLDLNGCIHTDSTYAIVNDIPSRPNTFYNSPLCVGDTLKLNANSVGGVSYSWSGPNSFTSAQKSPEKVNAVFADTGIYVVTAITSGCISPADSIYVSINAQPFVVIQSTKDSICAGEAVTFTAFANNAGASPSYQWYVNVQGVATGSTYTTSSLQHNDVIRCDMTDYVMCADNFTDISNDIQITVQPWLTPLVSITSDKTGPIKPYQYITFTATATNAGKPPLYQWKRNGADVLGANSYQWSANTLNDNDSISVEIVSTYKCPQPKAAKSNGIVVRILTSVGDIDGVEELTLYPNPNNGSFTIAGEKQNEDRIRFEILNVQGQVVYTDAIAGSVSAFSKQINTNYLPAGTYLFKLSSDSGSKTLLFVIQ